jgi:hypothetical protein
MNNLKIYKIDMSFEIFFGDENQNVLYVLLIVTTITIIGLTKLIIFDNYKRKSNTISISDIGETVEKSNGEAGAVKIVEPKMMAKIDTYLECEKCFKSDMKTARLIEGRAKAKLWAIKTYGNKYK